MMRLQGDELYQAQETKRREEEKMTQLIVMRNSRGRSTDYLKEVAGINRRSGQDNNGRIPLRNSLDVKRYLTKDDLPIDNRKKNICMNRIKNFDAMTKMKEDRIRLNADLFKRTYTSVSTSAPSDAWGENIEDYYIESIRAKLELLDELEGQGANVENECGGGGHGSYKGDSLVGETEAH
jgi:ferredoxin